MTSSKVSPIAPRARSLSRVVSDIFIVTIQFSFLTDALCGIIHNLQYQMKRLMLQYTKCNASIRDMRCEEMEKKQWVKPVLTTIPRDDAKAEWLRTVHDLVMEYEGLKKAQTDQPVQMIRAE